jgi:hypothetical protein
MVMVRKLLVAGAAAGVMAFSALAPASAEGRTAPSISFFAGGNGSAHWSHVDASTDSDGFSIELDVPGVSPPDFSGATLQHQAGTTAPTVAPSFDFMSTVTGASGGSPRLVIVFSDGGNINLRPLAWVANAWTREGSGTTTSDWDNSGGTCGFLYEQTYDVVTACHAGTTVTAAFVVSDSGWLYPTGYVNFIDNIQYNGVTLSAPSDNANN